MEDFDHLVLTGGNSSTLISDGHDINNDPLWSSRLLKTNPKAIQDVSRRFLDAGSDIVLTCTYQASVPGFMEHMGRSSEEAQRIIRNGVRIAREVADEFIQDRCKQEPEGDHRKPFVVGSIGPYGAYLSDASEYSGEYVDNLSVEEMVNWHRPMLECLISEEVDMVAAETIPAVKEAISIAQVMREFPNTKAWISFSVKNQKEISHGETFLEAVTTLVQYPQIIGVGINCTSPLNIEPLVQSIQGVTDKKILVYPNSGEVWEDKRWKSKDKVEPLSWYVPTWIDLGANWIGGCCRTTPEDITAIKEAMDAGKKG